MMKDKKKFKRESKKSQKNIYIFQIVISISQISVGD